MYIHHFNECSSDSPLFLDETKISVIVIDQIKVFNTTKDFDIMTKFFLYWPIIS